MTNQVDNLMKLALELRSVSNEQALSKALELKRALTAVIDPKSLNKVRNPKYPWKPLYEWDKCSKCFEDFSLSACDHCGSGRPDQYLKPEPTGCVRCTTPQKCKVYGCSPGTFTSEITKLKPCRSPYCECTEGKCTHPGCYDARGEIR